MIWTVIGNFYMVFKRKHQANHQMVKRQHCVPCEQFSFYPCSLLKDVEEFQEGLQERQNERSSSFPVLKGKFLPIKNDKDVRKTVIRFGKTFSDQESLSLPQHRLILERQFIQILNVIYLCLDVQY